MDIRLMSIIILENCRCIPRIWSSTHTKKLSEQSEKKINIRIRMYVDSSSGKKNVHNHCLKWQSHIASALHVCSRTHAHLLHEYHFRIYSWHFNGLSFPFLFSSLLFLLHVYRNTFFLFFFCIHLKSFDLNLVFNTNFVSSSLQQIFSTFILSTHY